MKPIMKFLLRMMASIAFALVTVPAAMGQSPRDIERAENERDLDLRSWNLKILALQYEHDKKRSRRQRPEQALAQLQEDFSHLQIANKSLLQAALGKDALNPRFVSKSVSEIRKCAARLNTNLALPEVEKSAVTVDTDAISSPQQLKPPILRLGRLIFSFIDNPFFREASVVDTQLTTKARRDLEDIIELSALIKKSSEQLSKTAPRGQ